MSPDGVSPSSSLSLHRLGRTVLLLTPLHLLAFLALYFGLLTLVRREIRVSQGEAAFILATSLVEDLHPLMASSRPDGIPEALAAFTAAHELLDLRLYDAAARPLIDEEPSDPSVAALLASHEETRFELRRTGGGWSLHGTLAIRSTARCQTCHPRDAVLGAAVLSYDVTPFLRAAESRLRHSIALLVVGWIALVALVAVFSRGAVRRAVTRLRAEVQVHGDPYAVGGVPKLVLDPVSAELYSSLREVLRSQKMREEHVISRLQHTDRLASLGQLAAGLAHEIKNPVAGLQGALEILRDETEEPARRELFVQMIAETRRVAGTIQSLLHFARPGRPQRVAVDVGGLLGDIVQLLAPGLHRRAITLAVETAPDLPPFSLDPDQIRQVLVNLVNNAAEAMEHGAGRILLRATTFPGGDGLIIGVEDNGPGMTTDVRERIFEPFFTTKHFGTGLGLAVARTIVDQHGGRIEVSSSPGKGATFLIVLPGAGGEAQAHAEAASEFPVPHPGFTQ